MEQETKLYEFGYILTQALSEEEARNAAGELRAKAEGLRAIIAEEMPPKRRALAYPIARFSHGYFGWLRFMASAQIAVAFDQALKKEQRVIRSMMIIAKPDRQQRAVPRKRPSPLPVTKEKEAEIAEIDKKLEEILG